MSQDGAGLHCSRVQITTEEIPGQGVFWGWECRAERVPFPGSAPGEPSEAAKPLLVEPTVSGFSESVNPGVGPPATTDPRRLATPKREFPRDPAPWRPIVFRHPHLR